MLRFFAISVCLMALAACGKSPEQKVEKAQEKAIDVRTSAQEEQRQVRQDLGEEQAEMDEKTDEAVGKIEESQIKVEQAYEDVAKVHAEVAKDKIDAQEKLNAKMLELENRVANLAQRPALTDVAERNKFEQTMALVNANLADARTKMDSFAQVSPTEWQGPYETASNALTKLEDSIQKAE